MECKGVIGFRTARKAAAGTGRFAACCLLAAAQLFTSCGELFDVDDSGGAMPSAMSISRDTVDIMPGDSLRLSVSFSPTEPDNRGVMWMSLDSGVASMAGDTLVARTTGETVVTALSADGLLPDSCVVNVMSPWRIERSDFFYDTIVYADIKVCGRELGDGIAVGAFVDGELRGIAEARQAKGRSYALIRVYGPTGSGDEDTITFRCYDRRNVLLRHFSVGIPFDGETHGSLAHPVELHLE